MRLIALVPGGIAEQLLFFPTLASLKAQYPQATIDALVEPQAKAAYRVCPWVRETLTFDFQDRTGLADYLNLLGIIRDREYEVSLNADTGWGTALLLWLNGIPQRVGYALGAPWVLSNPVPYRPEQYRAYFYYDLLRGLGVSAPCPSLSLALPKEDIVWAEAEQQRLDLQGRNYIVIPASPAYPPALWQRVIAGIQERQGDLGILLVAGPAEEAWLQTVQRGQRNLKVSRPEDIGKLAALLAGANLVVCSEGAPLYLAMAVGTYTIALVGSAQENQRVPPPGERLTLIAEPSGQLSLIAPDTILQKIWST
ncbi:MAG: glycosyltransferase family 9 protein [Cyanobacteriota bacterium]|jgi:ADP-heptose:LPS heptosyltransferase